MKKLLLPLSLIWLLMSCDTNPSKLENNYYENARISSEYPFLVAGDSVVLHRYYQAEDEEQVADDEYSEDLYVQIPADISSFDYDADALKSLKISFHPHCFCIPTLGQIINDGSLKGEKSGSKWKVSGFVKIQSILQYDADSSFIDSHIYHIKIDNQFELDAL